MRPISSSSARTGPAHEPVRLPPANQIDFINLIVDHLTQHGLIEPRMLYSSPFTDVTPSGPEGIFDGAQIDELMALLGTVEKRAIAV